MTNTSTNLEREIGLSETPLIATAHTTEEAFTQLQQEWNELLSRSTFNNIFLTWEWQYNWWMAYQPGALWIITIRDENGQLFGLAPLFVDSANGEQVVREIGCVDVTDYLDLLVDQNCGEAVMDCLASFLADNRDYYDRINLCNLPPQSCTYQHFAPILQKYGFSTAFEQQEVCPIIELPSDWESFLMMLDKKQRHELRRKLRIAAGQPGLDWYMVNNEHNLETELSKFLKLMSESTEEKASFLADASNMAFFGRVMPVMWKNGWLQLSFLTLNGEPIATYLNFDYDQRILVYNSGLSLAHGQFSPGIVLVAHVIRYAVEHNYVEFDFLRGNEEYKYRLGGKDRPVYMLKAN